jgi:carbamoyl-phosphate synthase large subunit
MGHSCNVLFTSVGRRVELIRAFRHAFHALELHGSIVALDADPLAPALRVADCAYVVPRLDDPDFLRTLLQICEREHVSLVFPLIDPDVPFLAEHRAAIERTGARVVVVNREAAAIVGDKWRTHAWLKGIDVPTPDTWLPSEGYPKAMKYPVFVKPRFGSASKNCFKVRNARELRFFAAYVSDPIVQDWLPGPEVTSDVVCDMAGAVLGVVSRQRLEVRWGEVAKGVTVYDPVIASYCTRIAEELAAVGPITVQGMWHDGHFMFTEINARFGGGVLLGIAAGADSPLWLLADAAGLRVPHPPLGQYVTNMHLTRYDDSFILTSMSPQNRQGGRL